jgi:glucose-6-phosphate isomerase
MRLRPDINNMQDPIRASSGSYTRLSDHQAAMDEKTRVQDVASNAAMLLALMWYKIGEGKGMKDMVILPYKDRLVLFSKYLQQLVMESLGKELDLEVRPSIKGSRSTETRGRPFSMRMFSSSAMACIIFLSRLFR